MNGQYFVLPIIILLTIFYTLSYYLYTDNSISLRVYRLLWGVVLILSSVVVGSIGVLMIIFLNLNMLPIDDSIIFWHVQAGILTATTGFFHIHIHWHKIKGYF